VHSLLTLILQVGVILALARFVGLLFRRINQPQVMGEMVAGILLGPSLLGWALPGLSAALFPPESLPSLNAVSQIGLLLFMFLVGLELDPQLLRGRGHSAVAISHTSIIAPFLLGTGLALYLYPRLAEHHVTFAQFALFMGAAMSVTAFPVLARILNERNLLRTKVGATTIACAAVDDVTAWCILAGVVAFVRTAETQHTLSFTVGGSLLYVAVMVWGGRRALRWLESYYLNRGRLTQDSIGIVLLCLLGSAWITEWLGIHALFGAFLIGAVMPKQAGFVDELVGKLEDVTVVLLLPLFFAYTGLRTRIGLLNGATMWLDCGLVIVVAVAGKFGGSAIAARLTGLSWREASAVGVLMNTRGLMELVILTIGLDLGVIPPSVFVMMVLMALVTTFMTTPLLHWVYPLRMIREEAVAADAGREIYSVLVPVGLPSSGPDLLRAALTLAAPEGLRIYALHLMRASDQALIGGGARPPHYDEALQPLIEAAAERAVTVHPLAFVSRDAGKDISAVAHDKGAQLILMGWHKPVLSQSILGGTVNTVMREARTDVAVYVHAHDAPWCRVLVPYSGGLHDRAALELARRVAKHNGAQVTVLHVVQPQRRSGDPQLGLTANPDLTDSGHVQLRVVESNDPLETAVREVRQGYDLLIIGVSEAWGLEPAFFGRRHERLAAESAASLLIVRKFDGASA